jgi:hypothetical protein
LGFETGYLLGSEFSRVGNGEAQIDFHSATEYLPLPAAPYRSNSRDRQVEAVRFIGVYWAHNESREIEKSSRANARKLTSSSPH